MNALAVLVALIGVFVIGTFHPDELTVSRFVPAAENASPETLQVVFVKNATGEIGNSARHRLIANGVAKHCFAVRSEFKDEVPNLAPGKFKRAQVVDASRLQILAWPLWLAEVKINAAFFNDRLRTSDIRQTIGNASWLHFSLNKYFAQDDFRSVRRVELISRQLKGAHSGLVLPATYDDQPKGEAGDGNGGQGAEGAIVPIEETRKPYPDWLGWLLWGGYLGFPLVCGWTQSGDGRLSRVGRWGMYGWLGSFIALPVLMAFALR